MCKYTKPLADFLTQLRILLAVCIAWLGISRGKEALPQVVLAVITSWATDILDGPLARRDPRGKQTWTGQHDAEADLSTSLGLSLYLVFSHYVSIWIGLGIPLLTLILWFFHSPQLSWPFYASPYAILTGIAFQFNPIWGWVIVLYLSITLILRWQRLKTKALPEFFGAVKSWRSWRSTRWHRD